MIKKFLLLCFLSVFAFCENPFKDLEFEPNKNLKILILDENMQIKEVFDIDSKKTDNVELKLDENEKFYITIIQKDSKIENEKLAQSLKEAKKPILAESTTESTPNPEEKSLYEGRFERNRFMGGLLGFEPDRFNYILPLNFSSSKEPNQRKQTEAKFQISIKKRLFEDLIFRDLDLYFAYTQQSFWQVYDTQNSKPFRESNYEPSLYLSYPLEKYPVFFDRVNFGYMHQSNGGDLSNSRSWDRIFVEGVYGYENFIMSLKAWYRIPEDGSKDDNPDIASYLGYGELSVGYLWRKHLITATWRNNLRSDNRGSILVDYSYPIYKNLYFYLQFFNGYGESLRDYNNSINRVGVGILFNR